MLMGISSFSSAPTPSLLLVSSMLASMDTGTARGMTWDCLAVPVRRLRSCCVQCAPLHAASQALSLGCKALAFKFAWLSNSFLDGTKYALE